MSSASMPHIRKEVTSRQTEPAFQTTSGGIVQLVSGEGTLETAKNLIRVISFDFVDRFSPRVTTDPRNHTK
jgi:hypothetical protein